MTDASLSLAPSFTLLEAIAYLKGDMGGASGSFDAALKVVVKAAENYLSPIFQGHVAAAVAKKEDARLNALEALRAQYIWRNPFGRAEA